MVRCLSGEAKGEAVAPVYHYRLFNHLQPRPPKPPLAPHLPAPTTDPQSNHSSHQFRRHRCCVSKPFFLTGVHCDP